ncbi:MAG: hypothetical protein R2880_06080 [Deinococcales bacterium]
MPKALSQNYCYKSFKMNFTDDASMEQDILKSPDFNALIQESYTLTSSGLHITRYQGDVCSRFRIWQEETGIFLAEEPLEFSKPLDKELFQEEHDSNEQRCLIPFPLVEGHSYQDRYGRITIQSLDDLSLKVIDELLDNDGNRKALTCTSYKLHEWMVSQTFESAQMTYHLDRCV